MRIFRDEGQCIAVDTGRWIPGEKQAAKYLNSKKAIRLTAGWPFFL
jgi:hypothetical protein